MNVYDSMLQGHNKASSIAPSLFVVIMVMTGAQLCTDDDSLNK